MNSPDLSAAPASHPSAYADLTPDKPAYVMEPSGEAVTYRQLEERSNQAAHLFRGEGLGDGDGIVLLLDNHPRFFELVWAAQRSGLRYTCVSPKLSTAEIEYVARDCGAKLVVTASSITLSDDLATTLSGVSLWNIGSTRQGFGDFLARAALYPIKPLADQSAGIDMLYSSGTTGFPKGIRRPRNPDQKFDDPDSAVLMMRALYGFDSRVVYLCPAPLYHAAPLHWCAATMRCGGTVIIMEKFDPALALALIEKHRVTVAQFVPTHFIRMLKLPGDERARYDLSSLSLAVHAAAPCPVPTKQAMIDWWGPIITEYYSGTEAVGMTLIRSEEWLRKKGSVGRAVGAEIRICDEDGEPLPAGVTGGVFFVSQYDFNYHNDAGKTAGVKNRHGWVTMGDVGHVDEDGYLFLTDRKSFMIISGGVNIYPQEIENLLIEHPAVADVAVIGAPDDEMGERVVAVVEPSPGYAPDDSLAAELSAFVRAQLSHVKCPRQVDFIDVMPRHDNGKLYKRLLRDRYWAGRSLVS